MSQSIDNEPTPPEHQPVSDTANETQPAVIPLPVIVRGTEVFCDSQVAIPYKVWVRLFVKHPISIMASKDVSSTANKAKKAARAVICSELKELFPHKEHTEAKVRKAFNNKKGLLFAKVDANKTETPLSPCQMTRNYIDVINRPGASNPSTNRMPGEVSSSQTTGTSSSVFCSPSLSSLCGTKRPAPPSPSHIPSPKKVKEGVAYLQQSVLKEQLIYFKTKNGTMQATHEAERSEMRSRIEQLEDIIATMQCQISRLQEVCGLNGQQGHQGAPGQSFLDQLMYDETSQQHIT